MIRFLIKKAFFDAWDNLLSLILMNLGFLLCLSLTILLPFTARTAPGLIMLILVIPGIFISHIYAGTISSLLCGISDNKSMSFSLLKPGFLKTWKASIILAAINSIMFITLTIVIPFYLSMGNLIGAVGAVIVFWLCVFWLLSSQYFFPIFLRMKGNIPSALKKSLLITLDNPFFSFFILFYSMVILILSIITALIMPGISAVLLLHQDAVRLRLYKYDWMEENPGRKKSEIPWEVLVREDMDIIGKRSLKGMIFPWKN